MTLLKRSKSLADLFRPRSRSRSSGRAAAAAVNLHSHASQTTASTSDADSLPAADAYARQANLRSSSVSTHLLRRLVGFAFTASLLAKTRVSWAEHALTELYAPSPRRRARGDRLRRP